MADRLEHEELLDLRLRADYRDGLLSHLRTAYGATVGGRYRVANLLAAGRQSYVFAAVDLEAGAPVVVKQPAFDYRHPVRIDRRAVGAARAALESERLVLDACATGELPRAIQLLTAPAIVASAGLCHALGGEELYLIEEMIEGRNLRDVAFHEGRDWPPADKEGLASRFAGRFLAFWESLRDAGWFYADISPGNLLVEQATRRLRVVDAGCAGPAAPRVRLRGLTPAFTTPNIYAAFESGRHVDGTAAAVLPPLAKVLHFFLTLCEPLNGSRSATDDGSLDQYSPACRKALEAMLCLDASPETLPAARSAIASWNGRDENRVGA